MIGGASVIRAPSPRHALVTSPFTGDEERHLRLRL
jgi:hypothetical protein